MNGKKMPFAGFFLLAALLSAAPAQASECYSFRDNAAIDSFVRATFGAEKYASVVTQCQGSCIAVVEGDLNGYFDNVKIHEDMAARMGEPAYYVVGPALDLAHYCVSGPGSHYSLYVRFDRMRTTNKVNYTIVNNNKMARVAF